MIAHCTHCTFRVPAPLGPLRCPSCGSPLEYRDIPPFSVNQIQPQRAGLWRYAHCLPLPDASRPLVTLGEGWTPLIDDVWQGIPVRWKMESLSPTGSYKDRGVSVMVNWLAAMGAEILIDDSSGNAGASIACYAGRAGLESTIYVPESAPDPKKAQIAIYGGELVEVPGPRSQCAIAAENATRGSREIAYASHAWHPAFLLGMMTLAWEIWEQGGQSAPDWVVCPVGNGGLITGLWRGFQHLHAGGLIPRLPHLLAVQAEPFTPLVYAFERGDALEDAPILQETIRADGIAISQPVRGAGALEALQQSDGIAVAVSDAEIARAHSALARRGVFVEPTSATVAAALEKAQEEMAEHTRGRSGGKSAAPSAPSIVAVLTGHGLKRPPSLTRGEGDD